jgi:acyl-CoA thioester hydrolase
MDRELKRSHATSVQVRYSEVDRMGLLYHVNYLEYFELARSDWVREFWRPYKEIEDAGYALVVTEAHLKYHRSALYDDMLRVEVVPVQWGNSRIKFEYAIYREGETEPLCTGSTSHCFIDRNGKATRMPPDLRARLEALSAQSVS